MNGFERHAANDSTKLDADRVKKVYNFARFPIQIAVDQ